MIDELLVSHLGQDSAIAQLADEICVGVVPIDENADAPFVETYIWLSNFDEDDELDLDGTSGLTRYRYDIECCSNEDRTAKRLARAVKKRLQGHCGAFGTLTSENGTETEGHADAIYVESKDDDYTPTNNFGTNSITVVAMDVLIFADDIQDDIEGV